MVEKFSIGPHKIENGLCLTHGYSVSANVPCPAYFEKHPATPQRLLKNAWKMRYEQWLQWLRETEGAR